jgi:quercetin dioxygenase-like cupin family protein
VLVSFERDVLPVEWRPGVQTRLHVSGATGAEQLCLMEQLCLPGTGAPPHRHEDAEEAIVVLAGRAHLHIEDEAAELGTGDTVVIPAGARHGFTNVGDDVLRTLAIFSAATPTVAYEGESATLEIGGRGINRRDAHRAYRDDAGASNAGA